MPDYDLLKTIHVSCAALSISGYVLRGIWMLRDSPLLTARAVRIAPHAIDTALLVSALLLAWRVQQFPFVHAWLTAKVLALVAYIVVGAIGLRHGRSKRVRAVAWAGAVLIFGYIVGVALTRSPTLGLVGAVAPY